jgi:hypothetical protein
MEEIVNYIGNTYEFEIVPCSIPASDLQYIKRNFYIWIMNSVSKKLFYFLRDKVSPIKYLNERPDGSVWLRKRMSDGKLCEIEVKTIYLFDHNGKEVKPYFNYSIRLFFDLDDFFIPVKSVGNTGLYEEIKLENLDTILIDKHLCQISELKEFNRNKKLENILNN